MEYFKGLLREHSSFIRILAAILLIVTIVLGVFWILKPDGNYEPWISVTGTLSAVLGVPSISNVIYSHKQNSSVKDEEDSIGFLIQLSPLSKGYWTEGNQALNMSMIPSFNEPCAHFFQIDIDGIGKRAAKKWIRSSMEYRDPSFDITLISELETSTIIHKLGLEIVSVAHQMGGYGAAQAEKINLQVSYIAEIPDLKSTVVTAKAVPPKQINFSIPIHMPDPFKLDPGGTFRYEILLNKYVINMPNLSIIRFWVQTHKRRYVSDCIHIFTL